MSRDDRKFRHYFLKYCLPVLLSAIVTSAITMVTFAYQSNENRLAEIRKGKIEAYNYFLENMLVPALVYTTTHRNSVDLLKANAGMVKPVMFGSACVIKEINNAYKYSSGTPYFDSETYQKILKILHDDINSEAECDEQLDSRDITFFQNTVIYK